MWEVILISPGYFFIALVLLLAGIAYSVSQLRLGFGLPTLAVLLTIGFWYFGDVMYNDYPAYLREFTVRNVNSAWGQVALFLFAFLLFVVLIPKRMRKRSSIYDLYRQGSFRDRQYQHAISVCFGICAAIWVGCVMFTLATSPSQVINFILPFLGERFDPFRRPQIGGGFSAVISLAQNLYLLAGAGFGVVLALSTNQRLRALAALGCLSVWSLFIFDRTRNSLIVIILPFILSWIFLRFRTSNLKRLAVLGVCVVLLEVWFSFIMEVRMQRGSVANTFFDSGMQAVVDSEARHAGLNMFEELCHLTYFYDVGKMTPNNGARYFTELVNIIPRGLWAGKPTIGVDYALARGQFFLPDGTISASISTGLIGQGSLNFGKFFGPIFAAFLMSLWVRILASIDTSRSKMKFPLILLGLVLTFNMGRDITLLVLYPFLFGYFLFVYAEYRNRRRPGAAVGLST
jgi:hypothetical protein